MVGGMAAMLVSGYFLVDCFRHESGRGACDDVVQQHTLPLVAGASAIIGTLGGLFTYNRRLDRPEDPQVKPLPAAYVARRQERFEVESALRDSFQAAIEQQPKEAFDPRRDTYIGSPAAAGDGSGNQDGSEPAEAQESLALRVAALRSEGLSLQRIADQLDTTIYRVRQALNAADA